MARDIVSAKLDIIFKKIFMENKDMLQSFVASMLEIPQESITDITVVNHEVPPDIPEGKFSRLDLNMVVNDKLVDVEIQLKNEPDFRERALYYWARLYSSGIRNGESYSELKQAITINIINFNMFDGEGYHYGVFPVVKETGEVFSEKFAIHFFELKKIGKIPDPQNKQKLWLQFLNAESEEEFEMINNTNVPIMQKAVNVIFDMSKDTRVREAARMREKALHDEASALHNAKQEGLAEGEARGMKKGRAEIIAKMRASGMTEEQIQAILGK